MECLPPCLCLCASAVRLFDLCAVFSYLILSTLWWDRIKGSLYNVMSGFAKVPNAAAEAWSYIKSIFQTGGIQMELTVCFL